MKQIEAMIMGQSYMLSCPDGQEKNMHQAIQQVDSAMCKIRDAAKIKARERIAVLAALNLAFDQAEQGNVSGAQTNAGESYHANGNHTSQDNAQLATLIERLDTVLGEDGRLL